MTEQDEPKGGNWELQVVENEAGIRRVAFVLRDGQDELLQVIALPIEGVFMMMQAFDFAAVETWGEEWVHFVARRRFEELKAQAEELATDGPLELLGKDITATYQRADEKDERGKLN